MALLRFALVVSLSVHGVLLAQQPTHRVTQLDADRWGDVARDIACSEYRFAPVEPGVYSAPNRAQGLRSRVGVDGVELFPRTTCADGIGAPWMLRLSTRSICGAEALGATAVLHDERVELLRDGSSEWYVNDERGVEQGWTIAASSGDATLRIELEVDGLAAVIAADARSATFVDAGGETRVLCDGLRAWDADDRALAVRLIECTHGFAIELDASDARYPVTIDPLFQGPGFYDTGMQGGALFGWSVAGVGDVNNGGLDDVLIGAPYFDAGETDEGRVYLYLGGPDGPWPPAVWVAESNVAGALFGSSVAGAGDVNDDGFTDMIVGAHGITNGATPPSRVYVYLGSNVAITLQQVITSPQSSAAFGISVSGAGDVNGDNYDDVVVGAHLYDNGQTDEGGVFLYLGSGTGTTTGPGLVGESNQAGAALGIGVSRAGDVDADGFDDVIAGAYGYSNGESGEGAAFLYEGGASMPYLTHTWTSESNQAAAYYGSSVAAAGNIDGDAYDDVIVGAPDYDNGEIDEGRAYFYRGSSTGLSSSPDWTAESNQAGAHFGHSVSGAGDLDGDGFDDVLVGAPRYDGFELDEGRVFVYAGQSASPWLGLSRTANNNQADSHFGFSVASAGHVNFDTFADFLVGAPQFDLTLVDEGSAYVYESVGCTDWTIYCTAGTTTNGCTPSLSATGFPRVTWISTPGFDVIVNNSEGQKSGIYFYGITGSAAVPWAPGSTSFLCVKAPTQRLCPQTSTGTDGACDGVMVCRFKEFVMNTPGALGSPFVAGTLVFMQAWFRDPPAPNTTNLSNALNFVICPP